MSNTSSTSNSSNNNNNTGLTDIPVSLLDQSEVLKHLLIGNNSPVNNNYPSVSGISRLNTTEDTLNASKISILGTSFNSTNSTAALNTSLLKSSLSVGAADHLHNEMNLTSGKAAPSRSSIDATSSGIGVAKLTSKSSSSGSVYSGHLDNITPTSGYSSASNSTQFSLNRSSNISSNITGAISDEGVGLNAGSNINRYSLGAFSGYTGGVTKLSDSTMSELMRDLPPPPAYPHWRLEKASVTPASDASLVGRNSGNHRDVVSLGRENLRGRSVASGAGTRDTRRDLSLGPNLGRDSSTKHVNTDNNREDSHPVGGVDRGILSKSQPDLSKLNPHNSTTISSASSRFKESTLLSEKLSPTELPGVVDLLYNENTALRLELEIYSRKVAKLQKFEGEILKVHTAHENLVQICSRREQLEKLARTKLLNQVQSLTKKNLDLKEELELLQSNRDYGGGNRLGSETEVSQLEKYWRF